MLSGASKKKIKNKNKMLTHVVLFLTVFAIGSGKSGVRRHFKLSCAGDNEVYLPEGTGPSCGDMQCDSLEGRPKMFFLAPAGCYCRAGYARNCQGKCIPTEQCQKPLCTGPNEYYLAEGDAPDCDPNCRRLDRKRICNMKEHCRTHRACGCFCIDGAARNDNGTCVPMVNCPMTRRRCFGTNEVFLNANEAPRCDAFCNQHALGDSIDNDDDNSGLLAKAGCYCREGYFRNDNMQCVERKFCKIQCPGKHEIFLPRGTAPRCEIRCSQSCPQSCLGLLDMPEGCYCKKGYCKNDRGMCIKENSEARCGSKKRRRSQILKDKQWERTDDETDNEENENKEDDTVDNTNIEYMWIK